MLNQLYDRLMNATLAILRRRVREKKKRPRQIEPDRSQMKIAAFENLSELIYLVRATPASLIQSVEWGRGARIRFSLSSNDISTRGFLVFIQ